MEYDTLFAIEHVAATIFAGTGRDVCEVVTRISFALREGHLEVARHQRGQQRLLLRRGAGTRDESRAQDRGQIRFDDQGFAESLHYAEQIHGTATESVAFCGYRQPEQADLGEPGPDAAAVTFGRRDDLVARVEVVLFFDEASDRRGQELLLFAVIEVHALQT